MNTRGSNAYQYEYNAASEEYFVSEAKVEEKKILLKEIKQKAYDGKIKRHIIFGISFIIALGVIVAYRYASVTQINYENHKLEAQYDELTAIAENLEVEIESNMSIAEIAEKAENNLGMHKPLSYQVKYIDVDSIDQTEYKRTEITVSENEDAPFYQRIMNKVKLFLGLI